MLKNVKTEELKLFEQQVQEYCTKVKSKSMIKSEPAEKKLGMK